MADDQANLTTTVAIPLKEVGAALEGIAMIQTTWSKILEDTRSGFPLSMATTILMSTWTGRRSVSSTSTYTTYPTSTESKLAVSEFNDYALRWWEQVVTAREIGGALEVSTWEEMKRIMRQRFILAIIRESYILSSGGSLKGPKQLKNTSRRWKDSKPAFTPKSEPEEFLTTKTRTRTSPVQLCPRARELKCFRCQGFGHYANECRNKKIMFIRDNGEVESEEEVSASQSKSQSQRSMSCACHGKASGSQKTLERSSPNTQGRAKRKPIPFAVLSRRRFAA
ncbi:unnamed protein product [Microthlaspi erraticum]|uniref:CCHC-type domain-containing protein n=1 Tax=Microthlaspi erraticum TaxID=1685480 RepID=A0A6D2HI38_9BRAS|nr:unnamed protein product [Microthlaspi erraticum]